MNFLKSVRKNIRENAALLVLLLLIVAFFWTFSKNHSYLSVYNIGYILNAMAVSAPLAVGGGIIIIFGDVDLAPGYIGTAAGTMMVALLTKAGMPWYLTIILALVLGAVFGLLNAFLINEWKMQSFIATLATGSFLAAGLAYIFVGGKTIQLKDPALVYIASTKIFGVITIPVIIALIIILVYGIILAKTSFGRSIYLCGENRKAARLVGLNPRKLSYILFANSGILGALAGVMYDIRLLSGHLTATNHHTFPAITAAILGGLVLGGGKGNMFGCFLGLLIISCFNNGLSVIGVPGLWQNVTSGALLLVALTVNYLTSLKGSKKNKKKGGEVVEQAA